MKRKLWLSGVLLATLVTGISPARASLDADDIFFLWWVFGGGARLAANLIVGTAYGLYTATAAGVQAAKEGAHRFKSRVLENKDYYCLIGSTQATGQNRLIIRHKPTGTHALFACMQQITASRLPVAPGTILYLERFKDKKLSAQGPYQPTKVKGLKTYLCLLDDVANFRTGLKKGDYADSLGVTVDDIYPEVFYAKTGKEAFNACKKSLTDMKRAANGFMQKVKSGASQMPAQDAQRIVDNVLARMEHGRKLSMLRYEGGSAAHVSEATGAEKRYKVSFIGSV